MRSTHTGRGRQIGLLVAAVVAAAAAAASAGCAGGVGGATPQPQVTAGTVIGKQHTDAVTEEDWDTRCVRYDRKGKCAKTERKFDGYDEVEPETWRLQLRDAAGQEGSVEVDEATFNRVNVGDQYPG